MENLLIIHGEECRTIPGYSRYVASKGGRIYRVIPKNSMELKAQNEDPDLKYFHEVKSKLQDGRRSRYLSLRCGLKNDNGKWACPSVPMLICLAFGKYPKKKTVNYYQVLYKDNNPANCSLENLKYIRRRPANHIINEHDVGIIRNLIRLNIPLRKIGEIYSISEMQVNRIKTGENWNKGKRLIFPPTAPFEIKDGKVRRFIATFERKKVGAADIVKYFTIKRDPEDPCKNLMEGIVNGFKLWKSHQNISRARVHVYNLNKYFFSEQIAGKQDAKINKILNNSHKGVKPVEELSNRKRKRSKETSRTWTYKDATQEEIVAVG